MTRLPIETLALPYACSDPSCGCRHPYTTEGGSVRVAPRTGDAWDVLVYDALGMLIDVFRSHDLNDALRLVHECYPAVRFDPEET